MPGSCPNRVRFASHVWEEVEFGDFFAQDVSPAVWVFLTQDVSLAFGDGSFVVQDVPLAVLGWRLLVCHSNIATSISAAILILHCGPQCFSHGALALCTLMKRWGSNFGALEVPFCHHQIEGPPQYVSIRSLFWQAVGAAELGWAALGSHLQTKI